MKGRVYRLAVNRRLLLWLFREASVFDACRSPEFHPSALAFEFPEPQTPQFAVLELWLMIQRAIAGAGRGYQDVVLENLALRHQLRMLQRRVNDRASPQRIG